MFKLYLQCILFRCKYGKHVYENVIQIYKFLLKLTFLSVKHNIQKRDSVKICKQKRNSDHIIYNKESYFTCNILRQTSPSKYFSVGLYFLGSPQII